jgi:hypothetical protein
MVITTVVVSLVLAAALATSTVRKFTGMRDSMQLRDQLGLSPGLWNTVGLLEGAAVAGLLAGLVYTPIAITAAAGTVLLMTGAVGVHLRRGLTGTALARPAVVWLTAAAAVTLHSLILWEVA